jgi:hypothetical protein
LEFHGFHSSAFAGDEQQHGQISCTISPLFPTDSGIAGVHPSAMETTWKQATRTGPESRLRIRFWRSVALAAMLCCVVNLAWADSFRCGQRLVRTGDDQSELLRICGDPVRRDSAQERVGSGSGQKTVKVQRWYYKSSGRKLERVVMIHEGKIIAVRTTGR